MPDQTLPILVPACSSGKMYGEFAPQQDKDSPLFRCKNLWQFICGSLNMGSAKKILIVDDEEDLCLLMKIYFSRKQYEVSIANTLQEGLAKLENLHPDVLFLDNNLPDGLGWDHAADILEKYPELELHLISAFHPNIPQNVDRARLRIMEKPFTQQQLNELGY